MEKNRVAKCTRRKVFSLRISFPLKILFGLRERFGALHRKTKLTHLRNLFAMGILPTKQQNFCMQKKKGGKKVKPKTFLIQTRHSTVNYDESVNCRVSWKYEN